MNAATDINIAEVLCHRDELEWLRHLVARDLEEARVELREALNGAQQAEADAEAHLADAEYQVSSDDDDDDNWDHPELEDARERLEDCRHYLNEMSDEVSRAQMQLRTKEYELEQQLRQMVSKLDGFLSNYADFTAWDQSGRLSSHSSGGGYGRSAARGKSNGASSSLPALPQGYSWVSLSALDWDAVPLDLAFGKASRQEIEDMLRVFNEKLMPLMRANPSLTRDDLHQLDQIAGRLTPGRQATSLTFAWDCMFSTDPVALSQGGGSAQYGWASGRHRALIAKKLGWTHLPARLV